MNPAPQTMPLTGLVVTILIIVLGIYDLVVVVVFKGTKSSVSDFLIRAGISSPFVTFVFGFVSGHLFGRMYPVDVTPLDNWWYVGSAVITGMGIGWMINQFTRKEVK